MAAILRTGSTPGQKIEIDSALLVERKWIILEFVVKCHIILITNYLYTTIRIGNSAKRKRETKMNTTLRNSTTFFETEEIIRLDALWSSQQERRYVSYLYSTGKLSNGTMFRPSDLLFTSPNMITYIKK